MVQGHSLHRRFDVVVSNDCKADAGQVLAGINAPKQRLELDDQHGHRLRVKSGIINPHKFRVCRCRERYGRPQVECSQINNGGAHGVSSKQVARVSNQRDLDVLSVVNNFTPTTPRRREPDRASACGPTPLRRLQPGQTRTRQSDRCCAAQRTPAARLQSRWPPSRPVRPKVAMPRSDAAKSTRWTINENICTFAVSTPSSSHSAADHDSLGRYNSTTLTYRLPPDADKFKHAPRHITIEKDASRC